MKKCREIEEWIEEQVIQEIEKQEQRCKSWPWPLNWVCSLVTFIVKVVVVVLTKVVRIVCELVTFLVNVTAAIINLILLIPFIGAVIRAVIRFVSSVISYVAGWVDGFFYAIGIKFTKHLRVHVVPLCEGLVPLAYQQHLEPIMKETERIFYQRAKIRVHTTYHDPIRNPPENALRLGTEADLIADELWLKGTWHQWNTLKMFDEEFSSLIGKGHPIVIYVIREVGYDGAGAIVGASGGPFVDWIAVERDSVIDRAKSNKLATSLTRPLTPWPPTVVTLDDGIGVENPYYSKRVIAHELCHSLGLLGHANATGTDLMVPGTITGDALSPLQVGIIRSSSHVTYL